MKSKLNFTPSRLSNLIFIDQPRTVFEPRARTREAKLCAGLGSDRHIRPRRRRGTTKRFGDATRTRRNFTVFCLRAKTTPRVRVKSRASVRFASLIGASPGKNWKLIESSRPVFGRSTGYLSERKRYPRVNCDVNVGCDGFLRDSGSGSRRRGVELGFRRRRN